MNWETVGGLSGAALGFIHNNLKGAKAGYKIGRHYGRTYQNKNKQMPTSGAKRKALNKMQKPRKKTKSTHTKSKTSKALVRSIAVQTGGASAHGASTLQAYARKGKRRVGPKKRRPVKVSRKLRSKINRVIDESKLHGYYQHVSWDRIFNLSSAAQSVTELPYVGGIVTGYPLSNAITGRMFNPLHVFHGVARAYGQPVSGTYPAFSTSNNAATFPAYAGSAFDFHNLVIDVKKQWYTQRFKNNSNKTLYLEIYDCSPKSITNADKPLEDWTSGCNDDIAAGKNPGSINPSKLHTTPFLVAEWNRAWKAQVTKVTMEPGQTWMRTVEGPAIRYDYSKFWRDGVFQENQKFALSTFVILKNDLGLEVSGTPSTLTPWSNTRAAEFNSGYRHIVVESVYHLKYSIPEQAGLTTNVGGTIVAGGRLDKRVEKYVVDVDLLGSGPATGDFRIDTQDPPTSLNIIS